MRRKVLTGIAAGIAAGLTTRTGFAQAPAFPNKTVRFIVDWDRAAAPTPAPASSRSASPRSPGSRPWSRTGPAQTR